MNVDPMTERGTYELTCESCGEVYLMKGPFSKDNLPICRRCYLIEGESRMTFKHLDERGKISFSEWPIRSDYLVAAKESALIAAGLSFVCWELHRRQMTVAAGIVGLLVVGFMAVCAISVWRALRGRKA